MVYDDKEFIAKKIRVYRKKAGLTQAQLAEIAGITSKQLSRIEIAQYMPSVPTFLRIVKALNIDISEFGMENVKFHNHKREEFNKFVYDLTDSELNFCFGMLKDILKNLRNFKK